MPQRSEYAGIMKILRAHEGLPFVNRILNRDKFPTLDLGNGNFATHKMAYSEADGRFYVYPTVVQEGPQLRALEPAAAYQRARQTGDFIEFNSGEDADWFSRRYKAAWGQ